MSILTRKLLAPTSTPTPPSNDPPFQKVALLLHGDGTNGAQNNTFIDSSSNAFTVTRTGNVAQGTFSPFSLAEGQWSNYFDGSGDYLTIATNSVFTYSTGDFTIECWVYLGKIGAQQQLIDQRNSGTATAVIPTLYVSSSDVLTYYVNGAAVITGTTTLSVGSWYHVAVSRNAGSTKMFLNGTQEGSTYSDSNDYAASRVVLGAQASSAANYLLGYLSNVRLVKGTAVYTSNFTPSTTPLTAVSGTSLLTCQSNRFKDNSSNNFTITKTGDTKTTAWSPFAPSAAYDASTNGGSGYFDGTGDYLTVGTDVVLSGDFTLEFFVYRTANEADGYTNVFSSTSPNTVQIGYNNSGAILFYAAGWIINQVGTAVTLGAWNHVAFVRSGSTVYGYVNGVQISSGTLSSATAVTITRIGAFISGGYEVNGYLSNVRITNTVVYSSAFTPPTAPLTAVSGTQLLLNCVNAGIYDNAGKNDIETVGDAQISTSVKKYGTGSMAFDGTGDWLLLADRPELRLESGNFTVECWLYLSATGAARGIVGKGTATTGWLLSTNSSNQLVYTDGSSTTTGSTALSGSTWYFVTVVRNGSSTGNVKIYLDGVADATSSGAITTSYTQANAMYVGANRTGGDAMNGYIDDLRITKGQALYTGNFTPPTQAFPNV